MAVLVKALGYYSHKGGKSAKGLSKLKAHLKYLEHGKAHPNEPKGFSSDRDEVSRAEFLEEVQKQPERGVIAHKLVFSLSEQERDEFCIDMRQLVRAAMDDWSSRLGRPLRWIGFEHLDKGHPHVHVVVAGYAGEKQVGIFEKELRAIRRSADIEKERYARLEKALPTEARTPGAHRNLDDIARELDSLRTLTRDRGLNMERGRIR